MPSNFPHPVLNRRAFLFGASATVSGITASAGHALPFLRRTTAPEPQEPRRLLMINQRTKEVFEDVYFNGQIYELEALNRFALFARDLRTDEVGEMDPHLLDMACHIQMLAGEDDPLILTHGFRSNARGGAPNSHHLHGQALDIAHARLGVRELHRLAATLGRGGLGRYARFIHIDTGETRRW